MTEGFCTRKTDSRKGCPYDVWKNNTQLVGACIARLPKSDEICGTTLRSFPTLVGALHEAPELGWVLHKPNGGTKIVGANCARKTRTNPMAGVEARHYAQIQFTLCKISRNASSAVPYVRRGASRSARATLQIRTNPRADGLRLCHYPFVALRHFP